MMNKPYAVTTLEPMGKHKYKHKHKQGYLPVNYDRYQGAVIDTDGNEQPITEQMILNACNALESFSYFLPASNPSALNRACRFSSNICQFPIRHRENSRRIG
jgi:hypothetical protein